MGDFHAAVTTLIESFSRTLAILKRSIFKTKRDVQSAYGREIGRVGPGFANGDAHKTLSAILTGFNALSNILISRFSPGHTTPATSTDHTALLILSKTARSDAIRTFSQLSIRLSRTSLALPASSRSKAKPGAVPKKKKSSVESGSWKPSLSRSPSKYLSTSATKRPKSSPKLPPKPSPPYQANTTQFLPLPPSHHHTHYTQRRPSPRKSILSSTSDSTKLGEIPAHKGVCHCIAIDGREMVFPIRTYFPLEAYHEPVKPRGRLRRLLSL
ncbi:hypothetical protein BJ878DRAFT_538904 [Calycina marina]|uniref:Uncharacterized protein n=1 Tax=Calycina marina TaxID=1763456 RepID=A0A9P7Z9N7_9HELO|nr:hypothetical protein BJ878DRAFT_538904 [Calycina marina]